MLTHWEIGFPSILRSLKAMPPIISPLWRITV